MTTVVVKLGTGNTASVLFALERLGAAAVLTDDPTRIVEAERLILPGVGAAGHAAHQIDRAGLRPILCAFNRPILGICLGQQLLYESSEEGEAQGLGLLPGRVVKLASIPSAPVPHMGWSRIQPHREHALLEGLGSPAYAYFAHSYVCPFGAETVATAEHGLSFPAMIAAGNVVGCQFHPERSGALGRRLLNNFLELPC